MVVLYALLSTVIVSLVSIVAALPLLLTKNVPQKLLSGLLSISVGTLLGSAFIHFLPEAASHGYTLGLALNVLLGFFVFFGIEKVVHKHHEHGEIKESHHHAYHLAPLNLAGEAVHNFIDGLVIAGSYLVSIPLGVAATISVIVHELPQEIADFGILLYSGFSKKKALVYNFIAASTAIIGTIIGLLLGKVSEGFTMFIIPFTAGAFIYIAASNLTPELHKDSEFKDLVYQLIAAALGVAIMIAIVLLGPGHTH